MGSHSKKVLITGINSFTGEHLKADLEKNGYDVFGCDISVSENSRNIVCDLRSKDSLTDCIKSVMPEYVIHLGAITYVPHGDVKMIYEVNTIGTVNLLESLLACGCDIRKILMPSTANLYGTPDVDFIDESVRPSPVNHYSVSKLAMEYAASLYFDKFPILITRPFNYTGVGQDKKFVIPKIISHFRGKKDVIEMGTTNVIRDFSDVRFVVSAYRRLLDSGAHSEAVNICSGEGTCLDDILAYASEISGQSIEVRVNPEFVRPNEIPKLIGSNNRLKQIIGDIAPIHIKDTVRWMLFA